VDKIEDVSSSANEVLARRTVAPSLIMPTVSSITTVDPNPKFTVYGTPLRISSTFGLSCTFRGDEQALLSKRVALHVDARLSLIKDEGSVLVFCVPV